MGYQSEQTNKPQQPADKNAPFNKDANQPNKPADQAKKSGMDAEACGTSGKKGNC